MQFADIINLYRKMTMISKKTIVEIAIEAGFHKYSVDTNLDNFIFFAGMIAELEREECAEICINEDDFKTQICALKILTRGLE